jgi:hypothetical protein
MVPIANISRDSRSMGQPLVTIFVRHSSDCSYRGDAFNKRCRCSKRLRWSVGGRQFRQSARASTWTDAETAKRKLQEQFNPASKDSAPAAEHKTIQQAIELFIDFKTAEGLDADVLKNIDGN